MSKLTRDDLRVPVFKSIGWAHRTVTDDELRKMGYVKIDSEAIGRIVESVDMCFEPSINEMGNGATWLDQIEAAVRHELLGGTE